ncbi:MAG TPA: hypothetical protein DEP17_11395 [Lachnospiraceae bacterium]|nr:hypothetical protein [Lachnospiraceae bacterium]
MLFSIHKFTENVLFGLVYKSIASISRLSSPTYLFAQVLLGVVYTSWASPWMMLLSVGALLPAECPHLSYG